MPLPLPHQGRHRRVRSRRLHRRHLRRPRQPGTGRCSRAAAPPSSPHVPGGQLMITTEVENYPGFPKGIQGPELMELFKAQAERFGTRVVTGDVTAVDLSTARSASRSTEGEIAAPRRSSSPPARRPSGWASRRSRSSRTTASRPAPPATARSSRGASCRRGRRRHRDGGGDLPDPVRPKVTIIHRRDEFRASKIMLDRARRNPKIALITNAVVDEILGELPRPGVTGVRAARHARQLDARAAGRRRLRRHRPPAEHGAVPGPARHGRGRLPQGASPADRAPRSRASSPAATSPTTSTARRSPPPAPAAWPPSTPSASSRTDTLP